MSLFCHQCGTENADNATSCRACGTALANPFQPGSVVGGGSGSLPAGSVPNYLIQSILMTICCCLPCGIVGIVYASQVNNFLFAGDFAAAKKASDAARLWCWIGLGIGLLVNVLLFAFGALMSIGMAAGQQNF